jgi:Uncharacterized protein encoded in toxicity protection region of plasmid R478, contains von Willebrand factor (vWF) domain
MKRIGNKRLNEIANTINDSMIETEELQIENTVVLMLTIIDTSSSQGQVIKINGQEDTKMNFTRNAAQEIYNAVRSNNISKDLVRTSLWTFSDNAKMIKSFAEEEESYEIPPLYPKGWTNLYESYVTIYKYLLENIHKCQNEGIRTYVIVNIITDGYPTDRINSDFKKIKNYKNRKHINDCLYLLGVYDKAKLNELKENFNRVYESSNDGMISDFISYVENVVYTVSKVSYTASSFNHSEQRIATIDDGLSYQKVGDTTSNDSQDREVIFKNGKIIIK